MFVIIFRNAFAFSISSVTRSSDAAIYRCVATNKEGLTVEKEIELIVSGMYVFLLSYFSWMYQNMLFDY